MPCKKCKDGKYKWGNTGECKYATKDECEKANPKKYSKMKPTPLGKTYEEYEKELKEFNLSKVERVELGLVDDIEKLVNNFKDVAKEESDVVTRIAKAISDYKPVVSNAKKLITKSSSIISKVEQQAKELGIKTKDIAKFDVLKNFTERSEERRVGKECRSRGSP